MGGGSEIRADGVVFVTTKGSGSLDRYSQKLAEHLEVETLETDIYKRSADLFNVPLTSAASLRGFRADLAFIRLLRRQTRLVHFPNHHLSRYGNFLSAPYVVTVHDLIRYFDLKAFGSPLIHSPNLRDRICLRLDYAGIAKARALIAVSETTKRDLVEHLGIPEERVFVVYEGVDRTLFHPASRRIVPEPYVLFVGSEHPRKNLTTLLRALAALKRDRRFAELRLVKVGAPGGPEAPFRARTLRVVRELGLEHDVVFAERVAEDDLPAFYSGAECFVLPSLYEGFGLPPLEAMACDCPVIVAAAGALPEIAGDGALVVPPLDEAALAHALRRVLTDAALRADLRARGRARVAEFSWEKTARETVAVYEAMGRDPTQKRRGSKTPSTRLLAPVKAAQPGGRAFNPAEGGEEG